MNSLIGNWLFRLAVVVSLAFPAVSPAPPLQNNQLSLVEPSACPPGGCAAGQRLTVRATFTLSAYEPSDQPNVGLCLYLPNDWMGDNALQPELTGEITRANYSEAAAHCEPAPDKYTLAGGIAASLTDNRWIADALNLSLRIGKTATMNGSILVSVLERSGGNWTRTSQLTLPLPVVPTASTVYVANDAGACGSASPCYVNSGGDLPGGIGTGLKDAVDAASDQTTVRVIGNYAIKSETVVVDRSLILSGQGDAAITYHGSACGNPMIKLAAGGTLRALNINDGSCTYPNRDLLLVDSPAEVWIESNDLTGGRDAIRVMPVGSKVNVRFNHISGNQGYAILREAGGTGNVEAVANNLYGNRSGAQVECNNRGTVNHNFWGRGVDVKTAVSRCQVDAAKRLGAAILQTDGAPGVQAEQALVTAQKRYSTLGGIGFYRTGNDPDYPLYIVNHGRGSAENIPFENPENLVACSNYWDVFLPDKVNPTGSLDLFFKYTSEPSCVAAIELSTEYCKSGDMTRYPLWWFDPAGSATEFWDTTGKPLGSASGGTGQQTTCRTSDDEIQVTIDTSGRPNFDDLRYAPFVVAIHSAALTHFTAEPGDKQVKITWRAASEVNTRGYFLHRSEQPNSGFQVIGEFFTATGGDMVAATYQYLDKNLTNNKTYYYRLEIVSENLSSTFTVPISAVPAVPTATPTMTGTPTRTPTITGSPTVTRTPWVYRTATRAPTRTPYRFPTVSAYRSPTPAATRTTTRTAVTQSPSPRATGAFTPGYPAGTPSPDGSDGYPVGEVTVSESPGPADSTQTPAETAQTTQTPTGQTTGVAAPGGSQKPPSASRGPLVLGGLLVGALFGLAVLAGGGWYLWRRSMLPPFLSFIPPSPANESGSKPPEPTE